MLLLVHWILAIVDTLVRLRLDRIADNVKYSFYGIFDCAFVFYAFDLV